MSKSKIKLIFWIIPPAVIGVFVASLIFSTIENKNIVPEKESLPAQAVLAMAVQPDTATQSQGNSTQ